MVKAWRCRRARSEHFHGSREGQVRIRGPQHRARSVFDPFAEDNRRRTCRAKLRGVLGIGKKREVAWTCGFDPRYPIDVDIAVALKTTAEARSNLLKLQRNEYATPGIRLNL